MTPRNHGWFTVWARLIGAAVVAMACSPAVVEAQTQATAARLTSITVVPKGEGTMVTLTASGPLAPGELQLLPGQPVRLYADFAGVTPAVAQVTLGGGDVVRVRTAVNNVTPLVSRVVIELYSRVAYRLDASDRDKGIVRILLGAAAGAAPATAASSTQLAGSRPATPVPSEKTKAAESSTATATSTDKPAPTEPIGASPAVEGRRLLTADARVALALDTNLDTRLPKPLPLVGGDPTGDKPQQGRRRPTGLEERQQRARTTVAEARSLYGQANYDGAAEAASRARDAVPDDGPAYLVYGRAMLERYRETADPGHLSQALDALRAVDGATLPKNDRVDLVLGLALGLYMGGDFRAAADMFATSLGLAEEADPALRDRAVDWWATAMSRHAQSLPPVDRTKTFAAMLDAMTEEAKHDPSSTAAGFWAVVATRGMGDLDRAWDAAVAHWVRAQLCRDGGDALREDLDKLMATTIIPERARRSPQGAANAGAVEAIMFTEWRGVKDKWNTR